MKTKRHCLSIFFAATFMAGSMQSCYGQAGIEGTWIEPVPGMENMTQGFRLEDGGRASSVNMATLQYEAWRRDGDRLILSGKSIGNGQTIEFSDTLDIITTSPEHLTLGKGGQYRIDYQKVKDIEAYKKSVAQEAISDGHNAENALDYEGTYTGTIPAADCPGIDVTLIVRKDKTFHLTYDYLERDSKFESEGNYLVQGNYLITIGEKNDSTYYKLEENRIRLLDYQKQIIKGKLEEMYILKKQQGE